MGYNQEHVGYSGLNGTFHGLYGQHMIEGVSEIGIDNIQNGHSLFRTPRILWLASHRFHIATEFRCNVQEKQEKKQVLKQENQAMTDDDSIIGGANPNARTSKGVFNTRTSDGANIFRLLLRPVQLVLVQRTDTYGGLLRYLLHLLNLFILGAIRGL